MMMLRQRAVRWVGLTLTAAVLMAHAATGLADTPAKGQSPPIAAAASLRHALPEIVRSFATVTDGAPRLTFGSSGNLMRQIMQGAPFELFLSADESYALKLSRSGLTEGDGAVYAVGRLAVLVSATSRIPLGGTADALGSALASKKLRRIAIANPEHAPYGRAAREYLESKALWNSPAFGLLIAENASQALQFALADPATAGLVPYGLALSVLATHQSKHVLVSAAHHAPLRHRMVLRKQASRSARALYQFMTSDPAQVILARHGFTRP